MARKKPAPPKTGDASDLKEVVSFTKIEGLTLDTLPTRRGGEDNGNKSQEERKQLKPLIPHVKPYLEKQPSEYGLVEIFNVSNEDTVSPHLWSVSYDASREVVFLSFVCHIGEPPSKGVKKVTSEAAQSRKDFLLGGLTGLKALKTSQTKSDKRSMLVSLTISEAQANSRASIENFLKVNSLDREEVIQKCLASGSLLPEEAPVKLNNLFAEVVIAPTVGAIKQGYRTAAVPTEAGYAVGALTFNITDAPMPFGVVQSVDISEFENEFFEDFAQNGQFVKSCTPDGLATAAIWAQKETGTNGRSFADIAFALAGKSVLRDAMKYPTDSDYASVIKKHFNDVQTARAFSAFISEKESATVGATPAE